MKTSFELLQGDPSTSFPSLANRVLIFSHQVFLSFKLSLLIFSQSFICLLYMHLEKRKLFWLELTWTRPRKLTSLKPLKSAFSGEQVSFFVQRKFNKSHNNQLLTLFLFSFAQSKVVFTLHTVFVDTRLWKTKIPWKLFQNFRQSYKLSTDRIEIHQSQPASMT